MNDMLVTSSLPPEIKPAELRELSGAVRPPPSPAKPIVYACSGCSDAGELADRVARELTRKGVAEMSCLAGIGGRVRSIMAKGEKAERILVIDGCPINCARKTLELAGLKEFAHFGLHEIGLRKGNCPVTQEKIEAGVVAAQKTLAADEAALPGLSASGLPAGYAANAAKNRESSDAAKGRLNTANIC